jgi:Uncharacterized lipoprotein
MSSTASVWRERMFSRGTPLVSAMASFALLTTGCAFIPVTVEPPAASESIRPSSIGRGREIVLAMPLEDARMDRSRCGTQKDAYNLETADVVCKLPPAYWLAQALSQGLQASGYVVTTAPSDAPSSVRVSGQVLQFFVEPKVGFFTFSPEADISVRLTMSTPSGLLAERTFYFKADQAAIVGLEANFQSASAAATQQAVRGMVLAITSLLDRHPELGPPRGAPVAVAALGANEVPR